MIKIALCDDTNDDLLTIKSLVDSYLTDRKLNADVSLFNHSDELLTLTETKNFHIYLLDIVMPMVNGIQTARELRWNDKNAKIVFITSEKSYALEAFDVNAVNYILKPVVKEKLYAVLDQILTDFNPEESEPITVKIKGGIKKIKLTDVTHIEYANHTVRYNLKNGEIVQTVTQRINFNEYLSQNIKDKNFARCHESFLVNLSYIDVLSKNQIELRNGNFIPVSKSRYPEIQSAYLDFKLE